LRGLLEARGRAGKIHVCTLSEMAIEILHARDEAPGATTLALVDDVTAAALFEDACTSLFALEWPELAVAQIDPEVTGLRSPQRFAAAAYRLIRKLRAGLVSPEAFRTAGLRGATEFYGRPPNFSSSDLILATAQKYRDSLRVSQSELDRQRTREVDLVLILARLYEMYVATLAERSVVTAGDAVYEAASLVRSRPALREHVKGRFAYAGVDDAQDLTPAGLGLLCAIFGNELRGVTFAGDVSQATCGFAAGARGAEVFKSAACTIAFAERGRRAPAIERAALLGLDPLLPQAQSAAATEASAVSLYRAENARDEARFIAGEVTRLIASGTEPCAIAIVTRHLHCAGGYIDALLARDVPVDVGGNIDLHEFPAVLDALAALWAAVDPFRHDYLLRNLEAPWLRLSDASIATLCGEASDPQPLLFELPEDEDDEARAGRWDRRRDLRLGRNLTRGDVDNDLGTEARERVVAFREARERWASLARTLRASALARTILDETVLATLSDGARGRFEANLVARLLARIDEFEAREPLATLHDFLHAVDRADRLESGPPPLLRSNRHAVAVIDVEAAKGEEFDAVFIPDLHAGAWPRYYVPDAFLYMPSIGMIAKENVGDAASARTAKFTYALYRYRLREKYNAEERRAFYTAATRARKRLFLSAAGRATRGVSAPEILSEIERTTLT
jgi:superfamily I DNA/RNA helicase